MFFYITTHKSLGGPNSRNEWSNRYLYEVNGNADVTAAALETAALALLNIERTASVSSVFVDRAVISTAAKGDTGPLSMKTVPYGQYGAQAVSDAEDFDTMWPLEFVVNIDFGGPSGRTGGKEYRGMLHSGNVFIRNGEMSLQNGPNADELFGQAIPQLFQNENLSGLRIEAREGNNIVGRVITTVGFGGISLRQRDRRSGKGSVTTESGAASRWAEGLRLLQEAYFWYNVASPAGKVINGAAFLAKIAATKAFAQGLPVPALPQGD